MVGRQLELDAAACFLDSVERGPAALVFQGEPGIGKTTVWLASLDQARARGFTTLSCRPAQAEAKLSYAGLADLTGEAATEDVLAPLPGPQREALEIALLHSAPGAEPPEQRVVYSSFSSLLAELASRGPVVVAIDDVQWLDRPSQAALEFVLRRLGKQRIGVLAAERVAAGVGMPPSMRRAFDEAGADRHTLGPLSVSALHEIVERELGAAPPRPILIRIAAASNGNPFYAIEIARELGRHEHVSPGTALPIPGDLSELVRARIRRLPRATREALLDAAALASPTTELVDAVALEPAERAGLVHVLGERVSFVHPLFASAVYASATAAQRRGLHRRLSGRVRELEERARHLALAATGPSQRIARALDGAAASARGRGSPESAAALTELAIELTPPLRREDRAARRLAAAEHHFHAGDLVRARVLAEQVVAEEQGGVTRGHALRIVGEIRYHESSFAEALPVFTEALTLLPDAANQVELHINLAYAHVNLGDVAAAGPHAAAGVDAARGGDDGLLAIALAVSVIVGFYAGERLDREALERALELEHPDRQIVMPLRPSLIAGIVLHIADDLERAERLFLALRARTLERGEDSDLPLLAAQIAMLVRRNGRPREALAYLDEGYAIARMVGSDTGRVLILAERCHALGLVGDVEQARADADEAERLAVESGYWFGSWWTRWGVASLDLSLGNPAAAAERLEPVAQLVAARGACDPISSTFLPETIEGLLGAGELERAETLNHILEEHGRFHARGSTLAAAARARALLAAARGDLADAEAQAEQALGLLPPSFPVELGRTLLVAGQLARRRRRRRAARELLERARAAFAGADATLWADRARAELERTGLRQAAGNQLTPTELRVAELAAQGSTNRQIAETVFLSPKTVEANLQRVYRKLGIRTRAELGREMAEREHASTE